MNDRGGFFGFISEHTELDITRPANSLKNWFIGIPIGLTLIFGVTVEGNPVSKFVSSLTMGFRRGVGSAIVENQPMMQEGVNSLYGKPTQPGDLNRRLPEQRTCSGWWCPQPANQQQR
jgi:hypothetical protein